MDIWDEEECITARDVINQLYSEGILQITPEIDKQFTEFIRMLGTSLAVAQWLSVHIQMYEQQLGEDPMRISFLQQDEEEFRRILDLKLQVKKRLEETFEELKKTRRDAEIFLVRFKFYHQGKWGGPQRVTENLC